MGHAFLETHKTRQEALFKNRDQSIQINKPVEGLDYLNQDSKQETAKLQEMSSYMEDNLVMSYLDIDCYSQNR